MRTSSFPNSPHDSTRCFCGVCGSPRPRRPTLCGSRPPKGRLGAGGGENRRAQRGGGGGHERWGRGDRGGSAGTHGQAISPPGGESGSAGQGRSPPLAPRWRRLFSRRPARCLRLLVGAAGEASGALCRGAGTRGGAGAWGPRGRCRWPRGARRHRIRCRRRSGCTGWTCTAHDEMRAVGDSDA